MTVPERTPVLPGDTPFTWAERVLAKHPKSSAPGSLSGESGLSGASASPQSPRRGRRDTSLILAEVTSYDDLLAERYDPDGVAGELYPALTA